MTSALVELVGPDGVSVGTATVERAHSAPGLLHRAFSVLLFDADSRVLLQLRAAAKTRFALRWGNACCGHPAPGTPVEAAAGRRLREELGLRSVVLRPAGVYMYRAEDATSGLVEHEYDHVLVGRIPADAPMTPDPAEVAKLRWTAPTELAADLAADPARYAPWLAGVLATAVAAESTGDR